MKKKIRQYSDLVIGSILLTIGIYLFVEPCGINFGGVIGISQIIDHFVRQLFNITSERNITGIVNLLINIPLFILALKIMNLEFCVKTMISLLIQTFILSMLSPLKSPLTDDVLLNCLFGAILCGIGVGLALRSRGSCGGIDIACMCLVKKNPGFKTGKISIFINAFIFAICLFIFDLKTTMYSIVFVAVLYSISDRFHDQNINIAALIFTECNHMKNVIMNEMGRGVTFWKGIGAYTGDTKEILFCAINKYEIHELKDIIVRTDENAFVTFFEEPIIEGGFEKRL